MSLYESPMISAVGSVHRNSCKQSLVVGHTILKIE